MSRQLQIKNNFKIKMWAYTSWEIKCNLKLKVNGQAIANKNSNYNLKIMLNRI